MQVMIQPQGIRFGRVVADILSPDGDQPGLEEYYTDPAVGRAAEGPHFVAFYWQPGVPVWFTGAAFSEAITASQDDRQPYLAEIPETTPPEGLYRYFSSCYSRDPAFEEQSYATALSAALIRQKAGR